MTLHEDLVQQLMSQSETILAKQSQLVTSQPHLILNACNHLVTKQDQLCSAFVSIIIPAIAEISLSKEHFLPEKNLKCSA